MTATQRPDFRNAISLLQAEAALPQNQATDRRSIFDSAISALQQESISPDEINAAQAAVVSAIQLLPDNDAAARAVIRDAAAALLTFHSARPLGSMPAARFADTAAAEITPRAIESDRLLVTEGGVVAFKGKSPGSEKPQLILLQPPAWAVRHLFGKGELRLVIPAGNRLDFMTGLTGSENEFLGFFPDSHSSSARHSFCFFQMKWTM